MTTIGKRKAKLWREWLLTVIIAIGMLGVFVFGNITNPIGNVVYDHFMRWHGFKATQDIVIVSVDDHSLKDLGGWPLKRSTYATLLEELQNEHSYPKAIGIDLLFLDSTSDDKTLAQYIKDFQVILPLEYKIQDATKQSTQPLPPVAPLASAARLGHINLSFDSDGVIRSFKAMDSQWPHFALAMHNRGDPKHPPYFTEELQRFRMVDPRVGFPTVSLADAIQHDFIREILKDKYVLIGVTAPSLSDRYPTLYSGKNNASTPGVAILASVLNASLNHELIQITPQWIMFTVAATILFVMLQSLIFLSPRNFLILTLALTLMTVALSYFLLSVKNYWFDPTSFVFVALIIHPLWTWRRLEAIAHAVQDNVENLMQLHTARPEDEIIESSREFVLQYGKLLDQAVASAKSELNFLSAVVEEIPDAVLIYDENDELLLCNRQIYALFSEKLLATGSSILVLSQSIGIPSSVFTTFKHQDKDANAQHTYATQTLLGNKVFYIKTSSLPSPLGGNLKLIILIDVTELQQSQHQRDRALQFLSHDMRTPLASIMSLTQKEKLDTIARNNIRHHSEALLQMMDDFILTISAEASQYKFKEELLDNILNDSIEQVADLARARDIQIRNDTLVSQIFIMANTRLLVRAFVNLLFNAVKFAPNGCNILVTSHLNQTGDQMVLVTISNPVGLEKIENDLTPSMPGFGLGLDFVESVIEKHHGFFDRHIPLEGTAYIEITLPYIHYEN